VKKQAGRAFGFVSLRLPREGEEVTPQTFTFQLHKEKLRKAELRDGHYLLRSNLVGENPEVLWERYIQLTQIEAAFKTLKRDCVRFITRWRSGWKPTSSWPSWPTPFR